MVEMMHLAAPARQAGVQGPGQWPTQWSLPEDHGHCPRAGTSVYTSAHWLSAWAGVHEARRQGVHVVIARGQSPARGGRLHVCALAFLRGQRA